MSLKSLFGNETWLAALEACFRFNFRARFCFDETNKVCFQCCLCTTGLSFCIKGTLHSISSVESEPFRCGTEFRRSFPSSAAVWPIPTRGSRSSRLRISLALWPFSPCVLVSFLHSWNHFKDLVLKVCRVKFSVRAFSRMPCIKSVRKK